MLGAMEYNCIMCRKKNKKIIRKKFKKAIDKKDDLCYTYMEKEVERTCSHPSATARGVNTEALLKGGVYVVCSAEITSSYLFFLEVFTH